MITEGTSSTRSSNIRLLCPTRWTVRADAMLSILQNYNTLDNLWQWSLENVSDTDMKARIRGVQTHMYKFTFFFGVTLGQFLFRHADRLSRALQGSNVSAAEGQLMAEITARTLKHLREDSEFDKFWFNILSDAKSAGVDDPDLPRQRRVPARLETGQAKPEYIDNIKNYFRSIYYEALYLIINTVEGRFNQKDYKLYARCEQLLIKAANGEDFSSDLKTVVEFYKDDFNEPNLHSCLISLSCNIKTSDSPITLMSIIKYCQYLSSGQKYLMRDVIKLCKLILVVPATNAVSERSFSALRRLKTYLRSTMTQQRINNCMVLHVHDDLTDMLNLIDIANDFVFESEHRASIFGTFVTEDLTRKREGTSVGTQTITG